MGLEQRHVENEWYKTNRPRCVGFVAHCFASRAVARPSRLATCPFPDSDTKEESCASCSQMLSVVVARQSAIIDVGPLNPAKRFERDWTKGRAGNQESCRRLAHDDRVTTLTAI